MPTYRATTISLCTQSGLAIPESAPPQSQEDASVAVLIPQEVEEDASRRNIYVPVHPNNQFWGKTLFGVFDAGFNWRYGRGRTEKRGLRFATKKEEAWKSISGPGIGEQVLEIRVHRADGGKRTPEKFAVTKIQSIERRKLEVSSKSRSLINAGPAPRQHPKRFYKFSLIYSLDAPLATIRFYYRTWDQLSALGVDVHRCYNLVDQSSSPSSSYASTMIPSLILNIPEDYKNDHDTPQSDNFSFVFADSASQSDLAVTRTRSRHR
ncbi:hypothetical protein M501DRAFT_1058677 [Patellaria atrata CBS 101060]|uniref:Uncharacterized protein n=1 Tax=Patellaria atrata CBS 101060 TaxID=1346257 RepID=A0A9P4VPY1_9PEZI|nr:hypothetical protein M501DRAFT_1058677 [Patellaria atrata CBS 101060]